MCSRAYLASLTGLKQATVTNIMKDFLNWGIVTEVGFLNGSKGRRSIGVSISQDRYRVIGVRLAKTLQRRPVRFDRDTDHEEAGGF